MLAASGNQERIASMPAIFGGSEGCRSLFAVLSRVDNELCTNAIDHSGIARRKFHCNRVAKTHCSFGGNGVWAFVFRIGSADIESTLPIPPIVCRRLKKKQASKLDLFGITTERYFPVPWSHRSEPSGFSFGLPFNGKNN